VHAPSARAMATAAAPRRLLVLVIRFSHDSHRLAATSLEGRRREATLSVADEGTERLPSPRVGSGALSTGPPLPVSRKPREAK
jgi:hypothetical protein